MKDMRVIAPTICLVFGVRPPASADSPALNNVAKTLKPTEKLAVIVIDALGISTWNNAKLHTTTLNKLEKKSKHHRP